MDICFLITIRRHSNKNICEPNKILAKFNLLGHRGLYFRLLSAIQWGLYICRTRFRGYTFFASCQGWIFLYISTHTYHKCIPSDYKYIQMRKIATKMENITYILAVWQPFQWDQVCQKRSWASFSRYIAGIWTIASKLRILQYPSKVIKIGLVKTVSLSQRWTSYDD